ncbi:NAD(P)H-hydrate epimerase, partial [Clavibacter lycopersici]
LLRGPGRALAGRVELVDVGLDLSGATPMVRADR